MAGVGINQLKRIYTNQNDFRLGQIIGRAEGLQGEFKFVRYNDGADDPGVVGIRGMVAEYAKAAPTNDLNASGEPGTHTVTVDTSGAADRSAGILVGDSPLGFSGGGVYQDTEFGFIQLSGIPIVDIWMLAAASPAIAIARDEIIIPQSTSDGFADGVALGSMSQTQQYQALGYALADGELVVNDQALVLFPSGITTTARYQLDETVTLTGTGASGTGVVNEIFSSYSGAAETQWGMRVTGTSMIFATSGNTTFTGGTSSGAEAVAIAQLAGRIKAVNALLTLPAA